MEKMVGFKMPLTYLYYICHEFVLKLICISADPGRRKGERARE